MSELFRQWLWLPEQASTFALRVDRLHYFVITVTMVASFALGLTALYFLFKYSGRNRSLITPSVVPSAQFEVMIIVVPLAFFLSWFHIGYRDFTWYASPPSDATDVYVMAKKWMWKFSYPDGPNAVSTLHVPANRPVRLLLTSRDVIHSFWVPEFRIKQDVLPGRYTSTWFEATRPGRYQIMCAEYCGTSHSQMWGEVVVLPPAEFDEWLLAQKGGDETERVDSGGTEPSAVRGFLQERGREVAVARGCLGCHSLDGTPHIGPTWLDLYLRVSPLANGTEVVANEAYLTESMMQPAVRVVRGFPPVMPSFQGRLEPPEVAALLELIKSLRSDRQRPTAPEEAVYEPVRR